MPQSSTSQAFCWHCACCHNAGRSDTKHLAPAKERAWHGALVVGGTRWHGAEGKLECSGLTLLLQPQLLPLGKGRGRCLAQERGTRRIPRAHLADKRPARRRGGPAVPPVVEMSTPGRARRERGSLAEYETQVKGEDLGRGSRWVGSPADRRTLWVWGGGSCGAAANQRVGGGVGLRGERGGGGVGGRWGAMSLTEGTGDGGAAAACGGSVGGYGRKGGGFAFGGGDGGPLVDGHCANGGRAAGGGRAV